jgi:8-oxo-dGTP diphosphatase
MKKTTLLVALGIIVRKGKVLIGLRNSPERPDEHLFWQVPGGKVEFAEHPERAMIREMKEETGFHVKMISKTPGICNVLWKFPTHQVHVVLLAYLCKIVRGKLLYGGRENLEWKWINKKDFKKFKFTPGSQQALAWWFKTFKKN